MREKKILVSPHSTSYLFNVRFSSIYSTQIIYIESCPLNSRNLNNTYTYSLVLSKQNDIMDGEKNNFKEIYYLVGYQLWITKRI